MATNHNSESKGSNLGQFIFIGLLLSIAFIWFLWLQFKHTFEAKDNQIARTEVSTTTNSNSTTLGDANALEFKLKNDVTIKAYSNGIEDQLIKFINSDDFKNATNENLKDKWFDFDKISFVFGKKELTPESGVQIKNIQEILKAHPDAQIKIGAYTDKKGNDENNLKLSQERADVVKSAIGSSQVTSAEGYGEKFATVDENASDEERAVDRKISVRLVKE